MVKIEQTDPFSQRKRPRLNLKCITPEDCTAKLSWPPSLSDRVTSLLCWRGQPFPLPLVQFDGLQEARELWDEQTDGLCSQRVAKRLRLALLQIYSAQTSAPHASQSLVKGRDSGRGETEMGPKQVALLKGQQWENLEREREKHVRPHPAPPAALSSTNILFMHTSDWTSYVRLIQHTAHHCWQRTPASV